MSMRRIFFNRAQALLDLSMQKRHELSNLYNGLLRNTVITIAYIVMWLMLIGILILQFSTGSENR